MRNASIKIIAFTTILWSFFSLPSQSTRLPGYLQPSPGIGYAYDSALSKVFGEMCVEGPLLTTELFKENTLIVENADFESILKSQGGSLSHRIPQHAASFILANDFAPTDTRINMFYSYEIISRKQSFDRENLRFKRTMKSPSMAKINKKKCGNEYISDIEYGARLTIALAIEFADITEKTMFSDKISLKTLGEPISSDTKTALELLSQNIGGRTKTKLTIREQGLGDFLSTMDFSACTIINLGNLDQCLRMLSNAMESATQKLEAVVCSQEYPSVLNFNTSSYPISIMPN